MIGPMPTTLVARTTPSARVRRRRVGTEEMGDEAATVEGADVPARHLAGVVAPGFDPAPVSTPRPAMRNVASAALAAILELQRGG